MRILLKCPTRSRPAKVIQTLSTYMKLANRPDLLGVCVSCDVDDVSMSRNLVTNELRSTISPAAWNGVFFSPNTTKIQACNADMDKVTYSWDVVVLVSDDMIPQVQGYDDVIRTHMLANFPDTNGILWFNDGHQKDRLNTLCIFGRKMYEEFGFIYQPNYKSLFCDTELTDQCRTTLKNRCVYIPYCIIRHEHPGTGFADQMDALYARNQKYWNADMYTYISRKTYTYDWSVLIPTIPGRERHLHALLQDLHAKKNAVCPDMRMQICVDFDNRESSIGMKRQRLLQGAEGKYMAFIDDDDDVTVAYFEDLWATIRGGFHTMRLRGQIAQHTFVHSLDVKLTDTMATFTDPPYFRRPPNHLNPMLTDVAKLISFKDAVRGEDLDWTIGLYRNNLLETQYVGNPDHIHYHYNLGDRIIGSDVIGHQQLITYETMLNSVFTPAGVPMSSPPPKQGGLRLGKNGFVSK